MTSNEKRLYTLTAFLCYFLAFSKFEDAPRISDSSSVIRRNIFEKMLRLITEKYGS